MVRVGVLAAVGLVLAVALAAALAPPAFSSASGVYDAKERGCYCHSDDASAAVGFSVEGLPGRYTPNQTYTIRITVVFTDVPPVANKSQGGFSFEASAGTVSVPAGSEDLVQVEGLQATQTLNGSKGRTWSVNWTAPAEPGLTVTFWVFVNTVNGSKSESFGTDHWTMKTIRIGVGDEPEITGPPPPSPPFAIGAYVVFAAAVVAGLYAFFTFRGARTVAPKDAPDNRQNKPAKKEPRRDK